VTLHRKYPHHRATFTTELRIGLFVKAVQCPPRPGSGANPGDLCICLDWEKPSIATANRF